MNERQERKPQAREFPNYFTFGSAVAPYQVEGNVSSERHNDWDAYFKQHPEDQSFKSTEIGPNWWSFPNAEQDISRLKDLGLQALRFGIEWARIEPEKGKINLKAIKRYQEIVDYIQELGLTPLVTLNHFTLPDWIGQEGGFASLGFGRRFRNYTDRVADNFGNVKDWITLNEPTNTLSLQYLSDEWPPKEKKILSVPRILGNMRRANHLAYDSLKKTIPDSKVGSSHTMIWLEPNNKQSRFQRASADVLNYVLNKAPIDIVTDRGNNADFIGYNYYTGYVFKPTPKLMGYGMKEETLGVPESFPPCFEVVLPEGDKPDTGWPMVPEFFLHSLQYLHRAFPDKPIVITENGIADRDDKFRAFYVLTHLIALHEAIQRGVDIRGYYYWSAIDNLEWMGGYKYKFGLIDVNPETGDRVVRKSAELYKEIATAVKIDVEKLASKYLTAEQQEKVIGIDQNLSFSP